MEAGYDRLHLEFKNGGKRRRCDGQSQMKEKGQGRIGAHGAARRQFKFGEGA